MAGSPRARLAQVGGGRVARDQVGEDERDERDADDEDDADPETPGQEPAEPGGGNPPGSGPVGALCCDRGQLTAVALAEVTIVDQPEAVGLEVLDPLGADDRPPPAG